MMRLLIAAIMALATYPAVGHAQSLGGSYTVVGTNLDGSRYAGSAEITATSDTTCTIAWTTGVTTSQGICMRTGDTLAASYVLGQDVGLVVYRVRVDGVLDGTWTAAGASGAGTETLTPR